MRLFIFTLITVTALNTFAAKPPELKTVNDYVNLALSLTDEQIDSTKGKWTCRHAISVNSGGSHFEGRGKNQQDAVTMSAMKCIRYKCNNMPNTLANARMELNRISDIELALIMKGVGHTQEEIDNALANRKNPDEAYLAETSTCRGGSDNLRAFAVDSCFMMPMECHKK